MSFSTFPATMRDIKFEEAENPDWQDYQSHINQPSESVSSYSASVPGANPRLPHANPQNSRDSHPRPNITTLSSQRSLSSSATPLLTSPTSLKSLKRPFGFQQPNNSPDGDGNEMAEPDVAQKPSIHQDHQLLSFFGLRDKHTLFGLNGHEQAFDLSLHLQGMFFLAETGTGIPTVGSNPSYQQPELTCYRRNLFSVAGSVSVPRGTLSVITDHGERVSVISQELSISATESVDGNAIRLIVIPWKTPPPNMPQLPAKQDQEPPSIPLLPFEGSDETGENIVCHIAWRRLQFRIATANNGRRKELQQHFLLHAKINARLSNGMNISVCEASTAPIVVRGRSPRNFQSKKETPLSSKSAAGTPMNLKSAATTLVGSPQASLTRDLPNVKDMNLQAVPQSFQFDTSHLPPFSTWPSPPQQIGLNSTATAKSLNSLSRGSLNILHSSQSSPDIRRHTSSVGEASYNFLPSPPIAPLASYPDNNTRPAKSPRHTHSPGNQPQMYHPFREHQEVSFHNTITDSESYDRDYFVGASHPEPWVSTGHANSGSANPHQQFQYQPDSQSHSAQYPWSNT